MAPRFPFSSMKEYFTSYRIKTREKRINLMNYLRTQRKRIIQRQREKLVKRIMFWSIFVSSSYLIYNQIYRKKVEINKMNSKLNNFYSTIMLRQSLKEDLSCITLSPKTVDQLTNIVSLAYRYHYKIIVRMDAVTKREKIIISEQFDTKCIFLNLSHLNAVKIHDINNTVYVEAGATCSQVNNILQQNGYAHLFPEQLSKQTIYDAIVDNLPLKSGELHPNITNMELVSASGKNFRSSTETNRYGQIPSLNPLFIGTGGVFAIPTAVNIKLLKQQRNNLLEQHLKLDVKDISERINALRKLHKEVNSQLIELKLSNSLDSFNELIITCQQKYPIFQKGLDICRHICHSQGIPVQQLQNGSNKKLFSLFFSINNSIFEQFILKFSHLPYEFEKGLLKVQINKSEDHQNHQKYIAVINEITNNNGVLVWCDIPQILLKIKPSIDSSEVGAQLMRKIVQIRQGLDRRNILYSHSRYQDYFAKGFFRRLTQYFW